MPDLLTPAPATDFARSKDWEEPSPVSEADALLALQGLESNDPKLDVPIVGNVDDTFRRRFTADLGTYKTSRDSLRLPLFPTEQAKTQQAKGRHHLDLFTGDLEGALSPDQHRALTERASLSSDPQRYTQRQILSSYLADLAGSPIPTHNLDRAIASYGQTALGLEQGDISSVFGAVQKRLIENRDSLPTLQRLLNDTAGAIYRGEAWAMPDLAVIPERLRPAYRDELSRAAYESRRTLRRIAPLSDALYRWALVEQGKFADATDSQPDTAPIPLSLGEATTRFQKLEPTEQAALLIQVQARFNQLPEDQRGLAHRALLSGTRGLDHLAAGAFELSDSLDTAAPPRLAGSTLRSDDPTAQQAQNATDRAALRQLVTGHPSADLVTPSDGLAAEALIRVTEQVPNFILFFGGAPGLSLMGASMAGQSYSDARLNYPGADPASQKMAAYASGALQLGTEFALTKLGLRLLSGKVPSLARLVSKAGIRNPAARSIIGGGLAATGVAAIEYTEEIIQDSTDTYLQDLAAEFSGIDPNTDWGTFLGNYSYKSPQGRAILMAILPYALLGSGAVGSFRHFAYGQYLIKNEAGLRAAGIPEASITEIIKSEPKQAQEKFKEAWKDIDAQEVSAQAEILLEAMRANAALAETAGTPIISSHLNTQTGETEWVLQLPPTAATAQQETSPETPDQLFRTEQEAHAGWREWRMQQHEADLDAITEAANQDLLERLQEPGRLTEATRVEDRTDTELTPDAAISLGLASVSQMAARLEMYAMEQGLTKAQAARDFGSLRIKARRFAAEARGGVYRSTVQLFRGADPKDVLEDMSEDFWARAFELDLYDRATAIGDIRRLEALTGNSYLQAGITFQTEQAANSKDGTDHLLEALSTVSVEYALGRIADGSLGSQLRQWLHSLIAYAGSLFSHAKLLTRSKDLHGQIAQGNIDRRLLDLISDSVGLNPSAQESRFRKQAQDQIAAEALGFFDEIGDAIKGRLPHPETLHRRNHPLAGEVEAIHDSLVTTTRKRNKRGKRIRNSQKANAFFLPIGEFIDLDEVREAMNEKGFDFQTPADLLAAVSDSLAYRIPTYATNSPTYSLSPAGQKSLESTIQARLSKGPKERVSFYRAIMDRLDAVLRRYEDFSLARDERDDLLSRLLEGTAEAEAIISALPPEVRGRVRVPTARILKAKTERGKLTIFRDLINQANDALEPYLVDQYRKAISTILDLARPRINESRRIQGRLTPETQLLIDKVLAAVPLSPVQVIAEVAGTEAAMEEMEPGSEEYLEAMDRLEVLDTFGALATLDAARLAEALTNLEWIYAKGRGQRRFIEEALRQERQGRIREVLDSLGLPHGPSQPELSKKTSNQERLADLAAGVVTGHWSFHQIMEWLFPKSSTARKFQKRARTAQRGATRHKIQARGRWESFARTTLGLTTKRQTNHLLNELSQRREWDTVKLQEGIAFEKTKLTEEQARSILAGKMKPGWHTDKIAMGSLLQAVADWDLLPPKERARKTFIRFSRLTNRGTSARLHMSDLEALYVLQLAGQAEYLPALDRYGFTETNLAHIAKAIDPRAIDVGDYLRREYADGWAVLNPLFQRLYGMNMPKIRNYAPGIFEHRDARPDGSLADPFGGGGAMGVNAMSSSFTKTRQNHLARPRQVNALAAYWAHTEQVGYFRHWAELSRDLRSTFRAPDVRRSIEARYGTKALSDFMSWLDTLELDGRFMATKVLAMDQLLQRALSAQAIIGLSWNVGTWFKQLSAAFGTAIHMPTREWFRGLQGVLANPSTLRRVWVSETIQQRILEGFSPEDQAVLRAARAKPSDLMKFLETGRLPIAFTDALLTTIGGSIAYQAAYKSAKAAGRNDAQAEIHALAVMDHAVHRSAQPVATQDRSLIENVYKNPFAQALFQFKSDPRQKFAIASEAIALMRRGDIKTPEAARRVLWSWVLYGLLGHLATDAFRSMTRDPEDDEVWEIEDYLKSALAGPITGLFFGGSVVDFILGKLITGHAWTNNPSPLDKAAEGLLNIRPSRITDGFDPDSDTTWRDVMDASVTYSRVLSQIAGSLDNRAAALSVAIRAARDITGGAATVWDLINGTSEEDRTDDLLQDEADALKLERAATSSARADAWADFRALDPDQQTRRLDTLYRGTTDDRALARLLEAKVQAQLLTPQERDIARFPVASRARLIGQIGQRMSAQDRAAWHDKLRRARVLTREVQALLPP